jgi:hypothetical protein
MAHFAEVDENGIVLRVLVVDDIYESIGQTFLADTCGLGGTWIKTSYNTYGGEHRSGGTALHKNFAGIGDVWDGTGFHAPSGPFESWTLDSTTYQWVPPTAKPNDGKAYQWNEANLAWEEVTPPTE